ncbi:MAG: sialidase family protein [bacterium]
MPIHMSKRVCLSILVCLWIPPVPGGDAQDVSKDPFRLVVCPASPDNPRNSEADIVELKDGTLLLAWSRFRGGEDDATAVIAAKKSRDGGRTWGDEFILQENFAKQNVMSVSLLRLASGKILFFFLAKNGPDDLHLYVRASTDEAQTWSDPLKVTQGPGYHIMNNARAIQLRSGRILCPIAWSPNIATQYQKQDCFCYYSDDEGATWKKSSSTVTLGSSPAMEPGLVELKDGTVMMIIRTALDRIYQAFSSGRGDTWGPPEASSLTAPAAPSTISRIPATGDLLMVWNNNPLGNKAGWQGRTPLTTAVSTDEGKTWKHIRNIEDDPNSGSAYTSVTWVDKRALLTYYHWKKGNPNFENTSLVLQSLPLSALYP